LILWVAAWCIGFGFLNTAHAQEPEKKCPDGYYKKLGPGNPRYIKDEYIWAVTPSFAKRFCMPDAFIATDLKGAEAIAYSPPTPSAQQICEMINQQEVCQPRIDEQRLELYVNSTANIPKFHPEVKYYYDSRKVQSSASLFTSKQPLRNARARHKREYLEPLGDRAPFSGACTRRAGGKTCNDRIYLSLSAIVGKNKVAVLGAGLTEHYYHANWNEGLDLIAMSGWSMGGMSGPRAPKAKYGYAIVARPENSKSHEKQFPDDFTHVIYVPQRIVDAILAIDRKSREALENAIKGTLQGKRQRFVVE